MDARDSSSAPAPGRGADGRVDDDDAGVMAATCGMARDAALLFQGGHFGECVEVLSQILQKKQDDPKVLHNIALAEFFHDGCSDPRKLLDLLNKVKKRSEDLAHTSREQMEVASSLGSNMISGCKGSGDQFSSANSANIPYADAFDTSIVTLNIAVILFHLHDYAHAFSLLEPLYQRLQPLDEAIALQVCLLLIDISLASNDASRAADVIQYIEKSFGVGYMTNLGDNGNIALQQSPNQTLKVTGVPSVLAVPDAFYSDSCTSTIVLENTFDRTLSEDAIDYETLLSTFDSGSPTITRANTNDISRVSTDLPAPAIDLKLKIHLYKVQLLLLTRNLKAAKREVKLIMNIARGRDSSTALLLKSQLEYCRGNYRKAIKLLMTSSSKTESGMLGMFNNNLGCIHHQLQKHHTSIAFFSRALRRNPLRLEKPVKLSTFSQDKSLLILYNCGLQYLSCGKPLVAARCFRETSQIFYNQPLLWLRFAECCLLALEKQLLKPKPSSLASGSEQVKLHVVGSGNWRQLVVNMSLRHGDSNFTSDSSSYSDNDDYIVSLPFARQCLLNALHLLNGLEQKYPSANASMSASEVDSNPTASAIVRNSNHRAAQACDAKVSNSTSISASANANGDSRESMGCAGSNATTIQNSVSTYDEMHRKENHMIMQAALADLAYVELSLGNHLRALSAAKALQQLPDCSRAYAFLSRVYAAEALCWLNRPKEAADHLSVYISEGNTIDLPCSEDDRKKFSLERFGDGEESNGFVAAKNSCPVELKCCTFLRAEEARGTLYVNLAAISAMQGDLEQAKIFVTKALLAVPNNPQALLAAVYVDLQLGKMSDALIKLKQCGQVKYFPSGITLSSSR
uniref:CCR4-NOT transcription complex subunit 10 n=1 Tax=Anthurium amnicola TaxID=1678845 RepID=A0A1D1XJ19_9ARAE